MRLKLQNLHKYVATVGGFLMLLGIVLLGIAALALSGYLDVGMLLERKYLATLALVMVVVGLLDTVSAIIIARW